MFTVKTLALFALIAACNPGTETLCEDTLDNDADGFVDCDDQDCAGDAACTEGDTDTDADSDTDTDTDTDTDVPLDDDEDGYVSIDDGGDDCDDGDASINPGADEYCNGVDDDCDDETDEAESVDASTWYADTDTDGFGDAGDSATACEAPTGMVSDATDCDDAEATTYPDADELVADGIDQDCDSVETCYEDTDGDGYGATTTVLSEDLDCDDAGEASSNADLDDSDGSTYPGAPEIPGDGIDQDGDGGDTCYVDDDGDSYGTTTTVASVDLDCEDSGESALTTDCDDAEASTYPGADEYCDGHDDDCDGDTDEDDAVDASTWYADVDGDAYGDPASTDVECTQPAGYIADDSDCDDADAAQYPGADEYCNGEDDDCDGLVDEDGEVLDGDTYYADADGDLTGDPASTIVACGLPAGYIDNTWDCDDSDGTEPVVVDAATGSSSGAGTMTSPLDAIQDGVDNATACVIVFAGTYYEAVHMNGVDLTVTGVEGTDVTMIDATGLGDAAYTVDSGETAATQVTGFSLTGDGHLETEVTSYGCTSIVTCYDYYYTYCGGGLYVSSSDPRLVDLVVEDSALPAAATVSSYPNTYYTSSYGGGVCLLDSAATLEDVDVLANWADQGGGLYADELTAFSWVKGHIYGNGATDGGGSQLDGGVATLVNLASSFNYASNSGGGALLLGAYGALENITLAGDDAPMGGGLYLEGSSAADVINTIIYGAATGEGVLVDTSAAYNGTYNDVYGNVGGNYSGVTDPTGVDGNMAADPIFVSWTDDGDETNEDLHLDTASPCIDAGSGAALYYDADGTVNDMGAYGGQGSDWD